MAIPDIFSNAHLLVRWLHVIAGIAWIGLLYFFNFVNVPLQGALDDAGKKAVNPQLMPRALWWFRWAAMVTFLAGLVLFVMVYYYTPESGFGANSNFKYMGQMADGTYGSTIADRAMWIMIAMTLATVMWFNVWFVIWPAQKKLLGGTAGDQAPALRKRALFASRTNTFLSAPMLFGMLAPAHYASFNVLTLIVTIIIGCGAIWFAINASSCVGKSV